MSEKKILGIVHIQASFNNTLITITDLDGNTISWASAGSSGFKGTRKNTAFAAQIAATKAGEKAYLSGLKKLTILLKGQGPGRETAIRALKNIGFTIVLIKDITSIPYNGCRSRKPRRV